MNPNAKNNLFGQEKCKSIKYREGPPKTMSFVFFSSKTLNVSFNIRGATAK